MASRTDLAYILLGLGGIFGTCLTGIVLVRHFDATHDVSRELYLLVDQPGMVVFMMTATVLAIVAHVVTRLRGLEDLLFERVPVWTIATAALTLSIFGTHIVYHGYALSMDEWMTRLQGELFRNGQVAGVVPPEWREEGRALYHAFVAYDDETGRAASDYRPGMALLWAGFDLIGASLYVSAVMNAAAVLLVARVARQVMPENAAAPVIAALLLATSQQALAASMTSYAMSAHLCLNLLWLNLFLNDTWRSHVLAALVGVATAGLHQIHFHAFFALPFLLTLLRPFRIKLIALYGGVYLVGSLGVYSWDWISINHAASPASDAGRSLSERLTRLFALPDAFAILTVTANLARLIAWQNVALIPLLVAGLVAASRQREMRLICLSVLVSLLPYPFLMPDQGHGWGYRYLHGLLGHFALVGALGWVTLWAKAPTRAAQRRWIACCLLFSPLVMIPLRGLQIEQFVRPYVLGTELVASQDADVVIVDTTAILVGVDLPRNSALRLSRPIQIADEYITADQLARICREYDVSVISAKRLSELGLIVMPLDTLQDLGAYIERRRVFMSEDCRSD